MKNFKCMDPDEVQKLLEGQEDVLTPLVKNEETRFRLSACPQCRADGCAPFVPPERPFVPGNPLPNKILKCQACRTEFDAYSGLITRSPTGEVDPLADGQSGLS